MRAVVLAMVLVACTGDDDDVAQPDPLAALPAPTSATTTRFSDSAVCAQCHLAGDDKPDTLHDATGANVSPVLLWRNSLMALAARDPYYLAVFAAEKKHGEPVTVDKLCTRCHAPAGSEERAETNAVLGFDDIASGSDAAANLARDGVTCTACHQIAAQDLGTDGSFNGGFDIGYDRQIFGPIANPNTAPMMLFVKYTPTYGTHVMQAELCGTCHTVIVGSIVEQGTYLEWRSSSFMANDTPCQSCHVSRNDTNGTPTTTLIANTGATNPRPIGRHGFVGGNTYIFQLFADALAWANPGITADDLAAAEARDRAHLATAAQVVVSGVSATGFTVQVVNKTGHKLPTGYPTRRMWLHVKATKGGATVYESGATNARGEIVDAGGNVLAMQPHRDSVAAADELQVWEAVMVDLQGNPTPRTLNAKHFSKDDRILPTGFAPTSKDAARLESTGVINDATFLPGSDSITYTAAIPSGAAISIDLCFQSTRPDELDAIAKDPTPAGVRFTSLTDARAIPVEILAHVDATVP
ncbi:MAG: hypothetical protein QM831_04455 [Kofleriaceae bacterium]